MLKKRVKKWLRVRGLLAPPVNPTHRVAGDEARDARRWESAADSYRRHLNSYPRDAKVWFDFGHALKEAHQLIEAEKAYKSGTRLLPNVLDGWLQLGHLRRRLGRMDQAHKAYSQAVRLGDVRSTDLARSTEKKARIHTAEPAPKGMTLYSVQDMLNYLEVHSLFTGIQRVQAGIALHLLDAGDDDIGFIMTDASGGLEKGDFWLLDKADLKDVISYVADSQVDHEELRRRMARCEVNARAVRAGSGNTVVLLGAFWGLGNTPDRFEGAKRNGARIGAYIYDVIPLSHPQYCDAQLTRYFSETMGPLCAMADFFLTISDYTRITLDAMMRDLNMRPVPMATVRLAHEMTVPKTAGVAWPQALSDIEGQPFVAYVSTVEGRKNHIYLVVAWHNLVAMGVTVPNLVFVGRQGWRIDPLMKILDETNYMNGRIRIVHDLTDAELNAIYERAKFTVFTSVVEGWGLPVGESLMHGTPCVASNAASIPEVGGDFVDYVDPTRVEDGIQVIGRMLTDEDYLNSRRQQIVENFRPRGWDAVARDFVDRVRELSTRAVMPIALLPMDSGVFLSMSNNVGPREPTLAMRTPLHILLGDQFYDAEPFGRWIKGEKACLEFRTDLLPGVPIVVKLGIASPEASANFSIMIQVGRDRRTSRVFRPMALAGTTASLAQSLVTVEGFVDSDGHARITLDLDEKAPDRTPDPRQFLIGLRGFGYAEDTAEGRLKLLESVMAA